MRVRPLIAGVGAGAVLAAGCFAAFDVATESADAQGGGAVTQAQFRKLEAKVTGVGQNSSAAQRIAKNLQNGVGKHVTSEGVLIGAKEPPGVIRQDRGLGGGLPEEVLSADVRAKLNASGATGPQGPAGPTGPQGPAGLSGLEEVTTEGFPSPVLVTVATPISSRLLSCPPGKMAIGGGVRQTLADGSALLAALGGNLNVITNGRVSPSEWRVSVENPSGVDRHYTASVLCANVNA